jgi:hypothetical protein
VHHLREGRVAVDGDAACRPKHSVVNFVPDLQELDGGALRGERLDEAICVAVGFFF